MGFVHFKSYIMKQLYKNLLLSIDKEEKTASRNSKSVICEAYHMLSFLRELLTEIKAEVLANGFASAQDEIVFFKCVKPQILGKLIYYNKFIILESNAPQTDELLQLYYAEQLKLLNKEFKKDIGASEFYKYYRSGRIDKDETFYRLGNINFYEGLNSFFFEVDTEFSTQYDYKIAKIISFDLLHNYVCSKLGKRDEFGKDAVSSVENSDFSWTDSKNALIELIYALHISGSVSHGRAGIKRITKLFEELFEVNLGDIHHAFHQMKFRAGEKASYLVFLKTSLEQYMDRDI